MGGGVAQRVFLQVDPSILSVRRGEGRDEETGERGTRRNGRGRGKKGREDKKGEREGRGVVMRLQVD